MRVSGIAKRHRWLRRRSGGGGAHMPRRTPDPRRPNKGGGDRPNPRTSRRPTAPRGAEGARGGGNAANRLSTGDPSMRREAKSHGNAGIARRSPAVSGGVSPGPMKTPTGRSVSLRWFSIIINNPQSVRKGDRPPNASFLALPKSGGRPTGDRPIILAIFANMYIRRDRQMVRNGKHLNMWTDVLRNGNMDRLLQ